jgi:surface antigen/LysM repeat protein
MLIKKVANQVVSAGEDVELALRSRSRHKRLNWALFGSNFAVVAGIIGIIAVSYKAPVEATTSQVNHAVSVLDQDSAPSIDEIVAADVATNVAQLAQLPVETNVQSLSISLAAKAELNQTDNNFLTKPQIVQEDSSREAISNYGAVAGDTVQSVAAKFSISEDTVRWANGLTSDALQGGRDLVIAGTTGIIYTVKSGDEIAGLADKYKADKERIVTYNNLELSGLVAGHKIVIPDGVLPTNERPGYKPPTRSGAVYLAVRPTIYAGNGYAYGYCTWYAYNRRAELGRPIGSNWGNASTWAAYARAAGFRVDKTPEPGAVFQTTAGWSGAGHVGIVERVNSDGSFLTSEMNYGGWNRISGRTISAGEVGQYYYIH